MTQPNSVEILAEPAPRRAWAMGWMIAASVGISFSGLVIRMIETADTLQIIFYRSLGIVLTVVIVMTWRYGFQAPSKLRGVGKAGLLAGAIMCCATMSFLESITNTTVANTLFMLGTIPFFTAGLAWFFLKEPLQRATVFTMMAAACGIIVMVSGGIGEGSVYGNLMGLVTALSFSTYAVIVRRNRNIEMLPVLIIAASINILICLILKSGDLALPLRDIMLSVFLGAVLSGAANVVFIAASKHLVAAELTLFLLLEFALGPIWVWLFINEVPTTVTLIGGAIIISSVAIRSIVELMQSRRRNRTPIPPR